MRRGEGVRPLGGGLRPQTTQVLEDRPPHSDRVHGGLAGPWQGQETVPATR